MLPDLNRVIEQVSKEKGIDRTIIVAAIEEAMLSAAKRTFGEDKNIEAQFNPDIGEVELFEIKTVAAVVEDAENQVTLEEARRTLDPDAEIGDELLAKLPAEKFGRIAAQAAKQNIMQRVRDAERESIYNEFRERRGELISGTVQRFEKKNIIVNLGRTDAILPEKEQIPRERYRQGDRIRGFLYDVDLATKGPQIVLSRTHPGLLVKLFEQEVPEIYEGIVEVKGAAREPGGRAKIAVTSHDDDVDPVGACVGMRGTRVQAVVQELRNEKIDIVHWTEDPAEYVCRALAPAKVSRIIVDDDEHAMEVIVPDDQLSLAIGKKGQNVRLASRLTGWRLDVRSEAQAAAEAQRSRELLTAIAGVDEALAEALYQAGLKTATDVVAAGAQALEDVAGGPADRIESMLESARARATIEAEEEARRVEEEARLAAEQAAAAAAREQAEALVNPNETVTVGENRE